MDIVFKIIGAAGLLSITIGVLTKNRIKQNFFFIIGGLLLLTYSAYLRDPIFIPLQIIFTLAAMFELYKLEKVKKH